MIINMRIFKIHLALVFINCTAALLTTFKDNRIPSVHHLAYREQQYSNQTNAPAVLSPANALSAARATTVSSPANAPSKSPDSSSSFYYCAFYSTSGSYYYSYSNNNAVRCAFTVCDAASFSVGTCSAFTGDTYIRLFNEEGSLLYANDDYCGRGSQINYPLSISGCKEFVLLSGCWSSFLCTGTPNVTVYQAPAVSYPANASSESPDSSSSSYYCASYSTSGSYYSSYSNNNAVRCAFTVCDAASFSVGTCSAFTGDTYLRLFDGEGSLLYANDDYCGRGSQINYPLSISGCKEFVLLSGCWSSNLCTGTPKVTVNQGSALGTSFTSTISPSSPPSVSPTTKFSSSSYYCASYSTSGSYYYSYSNNNAVRCSFTVCDAASFSVGTCSAFTGDTYLRLFNEEGSLLYANDNYCGAGSQINYPFSISGCKEFVLLSGCWSSFLCTGTPKVTVYQVSVLGISPSSPPSVSPTTDYLNDLDWHRFWALIIDIIVGFGICVVIIIGIYLNYICRGTKCTPVETTPNAQRFDLEENRQRDLANASATQQAGGTVVVAAEVVFTVSNNETRVDDIVVNEDAVVAASPSS